MNYQKKITMEDNQSISRMVACTEEAKICPDGSSVGRAGPDCNFAPCPSISINNDNSETFSGQITDIIYGCHYDNLCIVVIDNNQQVIVGQGEGPEQIDKGSSDIDLNTDNRSKYINKMVEVYAKKTNDNYYTIYGNKQYYVQLAANEPSP